MLSKTSSNVKIGRKKKIIDRESNSSTNLSASPLIFTIGNRVDAVKSSKSCTGFFTQD